MENDDDNGSKPPPLTNEQITEQIALLQQQLKWSLSLESAGANQRLEAFAALKNYDTTLTRCTDALNLIRQQRDEVNAAADERERRWVHERQQDAKEHTAAIIQYAKEIAALTKSLEVSKQLSAIGNEAKQTAEETKTAVEAVQKAAGDSVATVKAIENLSRKMDDVSGSHKLLVAEVEEAKEEKDEKKDPGWIRLSSRVLKFLERAPLRAHVALFFILVLLSALLVTLRTLDKVMSERENNNPTLAPKTAPKD